jgi:Polysaccharide lyase
VNAPAPRLIVFLLIALLAVYLAGPAPAVASHRGKGRAAQRAALGAARVVLKRDKARRARASRRHRQSTERTESTLSAAPAENPEVLFRGDFDSGFGNWHIQSLPDRISLFSSGVFEGSQAARFEVQSGDVEPETGSQRSEVSGPTFKEGEDLYIRDAVRVPSGNTFSAPWQIVQQLHEENWNGSPGVAVFLDSKRTLTLGPGDSSRTFWNSTPLQSDRWYDLVYRVKLSQDSSTGFVEVWLDGVQQTLANGQTRIYGQTMQTDETYLKAGIYRSKSSTGTSIVEHDAIVVGTSYSAVSTG